MRLIVELDGTRHETELVHTGSGVTIGDLVTRVCGAALRAEESVWVDDRRHGAGDLLADLRLLEGSRFAREPAPTAGVMSGWTVTRSGGLHAGQVVAVPARRPLTVGRSPHADITVDSPSASWSHLSVERDGDGVRVCDNGSTNGTFVDGVQIDAEGVLVEDDAVVLAGGTALLIRPALPETPAPHPGSQRTPTSAGTVPFNRPPRAGRPSGPEPLRPPTRKEVPAAARFSIIALVGPALIAAVMVVTMHNFAYAAVALLSPVLGIGTWYEQKRRRAREGVDEDGRFARTLETFGADLDRAAGAERRRRGEEAPDPATMLRRATLPATALWQRRHGDPDFLSLHAGIGNVPWIPPIDRQTAALLDDDVRPLIQQQDLAACPVRVDLTGAGVVGLVGNRADALAVARSLLLQATTHCGPADLTVSVCCDPGREDAWDWTGWLPHTRRLAEGRADTWTSGDLHRSEALLRVLREGIDEHPTPGVLLVLDTDVLLEGRDSAARALLGHGRSAGGPLPTGRPSVQVSGIVVADSEQLLPAACTVVIRVDEDAAGTVSRPHDRSRVEDVVLAGLDTATARDGAIHLARLDDPELVTAGARLPSTVRLNVLLGLDRVDAREIRDRWAARTGVSAPIGVGEDGVYRIDLVHDGPHGLVGGTTGSGKSEFLRSLVAGLAASVPPTELTFILMDFKGGAAFASCERLPHTIGTVSNLDEQLADRALRALEAEMEHRQRVFAAAGDGVDSLDAYLATNPDTPMPRLLLVVDEFAQLAKDYPEVLSSLVSVAAVGRTLGVHMILATQRPAGVVNDDILANTNLRVALRVQSREDSANVIGVPDASAIGRGQRGRGLIKLGQDDITPIQTALSSGPIDDKEAAPLQVRAVDFGRTPASVSSAEGSMPGSLSGNRTELDLLIDAIADAGRQTGHAPPRPVWPEPLGGAVALSGLGTHTSGGDASLLSSDGGSGAADPVFALSDDPGRQRQLPAGWDLKRGNLLLAGIPGSGTTTALSSIALALAGTRSPQELDLLVLEMGSRDLEPLAALPHTVGYVGTGAAAKEQQARLLRHLRGELERRQADPGPHRALVVLIDGLAALRDEYQELDGVELLDGLSRAYADGPEAGIHFAVTTTRIKAIPSAIDEVTTQKWLFRLADRYDYSGFGLQPAQIPAPVPGRCVPLETGLQTHVATPDQPVPAAARDIARQWGRPAPKASVVRRLPDTLTVAELGATASLAGEPWRLPIGIREADLDVGTLDLYEGEHLLIAGPVRSGKSLLLLALAEILHDADSPVEVWGLCGRRSPLAGSELLDRVAVGAEGLAGLVAAARLRTGNLALLIDDAEQFDDADHTIAELLRTCPGGLHIIAAGRDDDVRGRYGHWTTTVRKSRAGIVLQPSPDRDGEILGARIPRTSPVPLTPGRGYACADGTAVLVHVPRPTR